MSHRKRCLVLGASGFIGKNLMAVLPDDFDVVTLSLDVPKEIQCKNVENLSADFFDEKDLESAIVGCDIVIHLISTMTPAVANQSPARDVQENLLGTLRLLDLCVKHRVEKVIYSSSGGTVYGDISGFESIPETHTAEPSCSYGIIKLAVEKYLALYQKIYGLKSIALRISNPYGPHQVLKNAQGVIGSFLSKALQGESLEIWGDGTAVRDFIYIDDVVQSIIQAIKYEGEQKIFNIGSGIGTEIREIVDTIQTLMPHKQLKINYQKQNFSGVSRNVLDISRAKKSLDWLPKTVLQDGIKKTISFWQESFRT